MLTFYKQLSEKKNLDDNDDDYDYDMKRKQIFHSTICFSRFRFGYYCIIVIIINYSNL